MSAADTVSEHVLSKITKNQSIKCRDEGSEVKVGRMVLYANVSRV